MSQIEYYAFNAEGEMFPTNDRFFLDGMDLKWVFWNYEPNRDVNKWYRKTAGNWTRQGLNDVPKEHRTTLLLLGL